MTEDWQSDWDKFIDVLQEAISSGATTDSISHMFSGRSIRWRATIAEPEDSSPEVADIDFPERVLDLGNSCRAIMGPETVRIAKGTLSEWRNTPIGSEIHFSARFGPAGSPFPCVEVHRLSEARGLVSTKLIDARPIKDGE